VYLFIDPDNKELESLVEEYKSCQN